MEVRTWTFPASIVFHDVSFFRTLALPSCLHRSSLGFCRVSASSASSCAPLSPLDFLHRSIQPFSYDHRSIAHFATQSSRLESRTFAEKRKNVFLLETRFARKIRMRSTPNARLRRPSQPRGPYAAHASGGAHQTPSVAPSRVARDVHSTHGCGSGRQEARVRLH